MNLIAMLFSNGESATQYHTVLKPMRVVILIAGESPHHSLLHYYQHVAMPYAVQSYHPQEES